MHRKENMGFHSNHDMSSDEETDSRGSEGSCEDVSFVSDDDEVLVNMDMSGIPVLGWLHESLLYWIKFKSYVHNDTFAYDIYQGYFIEK